MLWRYIGLIFSFAFRRTTPAIDALQIVAASALPALAKISGLDTPERATSDVLAYIGFAAIAFVILRLLSAPYFIWSGQVTEICKLRDELSKPEHQVMDRLAKYRAKARAKLAAKLEDFQTLAFVDGWDLSCDAQVGAQMASIRRLQAKAGLSEEFDTGRGLLLVIVQNEGKKSNDLSDRESARILRLLQDYLVGSLTAEALSLQLPPHTPLKTPL